MTHEKVAVLILGAGPAGYTAGIYAARAGFKTILYQGPQPGGLLITTTDVDNYPGYPKGIDGRAMMENFKEQNLRFGVELRTGSATFVNFTTTVPHQVTIDNNHLITAEVVIIATGASSKWLGIPSEKRLLGKGVSTCAVCDGFFFKHQTVAVVGGGNSALEEAIYLAKICKKVYLLVRKGKFRATDIIQKQLINRPNIETCWYTEAQEILGKETVEGVRVVDNQTGEERDIPLQAFFIAIGHTPNTTIFPASFYDQAIKQNILFKDETGYIITRPGTAQTNIPGIFAAGDVQDKRYRQAITAAGSGCMAALDAEQYLASKQQNA